MNAATMKTDLAVDIARHSGGMGDDKAMRGRSPLSDAVRRSGNSIDECYRLIAFYAEPLASQRAFLELAMDAPLDCEGVSLVNLNLVNQSDAKGRGGAEGALPPSNVT
jgi:hypothetical protein